MHKMLRISPRLRVGISNVQYLLASAFLIASWLSHFHYTIIPSIYSIGRYHQLLLKKIISLLLYSINVSHNYRVLLFVFILLFL